jgi:alkaline phosphatase D
MKTISFKSYLSVIALIFLISAVDNPLISQHANLESGPMVGYVEMQETLIWLQTKSPADIVIEYWEDVPGATKYRSDVHKTSKESYLVAKIVLSDLKPSTTYRYEVMIDGSVASLPYPTTVTTQALWQWRSDPPDFTFALGSCFYINDAEYDRPGNPYGGEYAIVERIADKKPDFMLWLGDNMYLREADFYSVARINHRYSHTRRVPELQRLLASTAHYATWDDHDYGPNNADRNYSMKEDVLDIFTSYWGNPKAGHDGNKGVYFRFKWVDIDFFVTDGRYHRAPNALKDHEKAYLGKEQMQWLKDGLANSSAPFKIVLFGNQAINTGSPFEAFPAYTAEYNDLMGFIERQGVPGVVFMSGDRHHSELLRYESISQYPLYEFTVSPLTAGFSRQLVAEERGNPLRVDGKLTHQRNFGLVRVSGKGDERTLTLGNYDVNGNLLWDYTIKKADLELRRRRE